MSDAALTFTILVAAIGLFVWNRLPVGIVAIATALSLYATGLIDSTTALAGFGDPVVIFIAGLFVIAEGLESSGVTTWAGQQLLRRVGTRRGALLVALTALAGLLSAFITPNGATASLLPVMVLAARRSGAKTSRLAMPLAFAASGGALLALSGSTVNVIVSEALAEQTGRGFGFVEFAAVGAPLLVVTIVLAQVAGRLIPERTPDSLPADLSRHLDTILEHYRLDEGFFRLEVTPSSPVIGQAIEAVDAPDQVQFIGAQGSNGTPRARADVLKPADVIVVSGPTSSIAAFAEDCALTVVTTPLTPSTKAELLGREAGVAEIVVPPRSTLVGTRVFPGYAESGVVVLAVSHRGRDTGLTPTTLAEGDTLLVNGPWERIEALDASRNVLVVDSPDLIRRQAVALGTKAPRALAVLAITVVLLASGWVPAAIAALIGAALMVVTRVVVPQQAYRAISWQTVVLVGGLIPLSVAIKDSGAADIAARAVVDVVPSGNGRLLLLAIFVLTAGLSQVISNTATVLVVTPIAIAAAADFGVNLAPVLMMVAVAGAASFLTPIATPANMMVMSPGGYRFADYWKFGAIVMAAWVTLAILIIPMVWPLYQ